MIELGLSRIRPEQRQTTGGDYTDAVVRAIQAQAASLFDVAGTAAVEAAAGALSRAFAAAEVSGPSWARRAIGPEFLGQVGRELVRSGQSMHVIEVSELGELALLPASSWDFQGPGPHPSGWTVQAVVNGPSEAVTLYRPWASVVFCSWGNLTGRIFAGRGPLEWAHTSARLQSETERSLADEAAGPVAQLLPIPQDGGDGEEDDPLAKLKDDLRTARGKALLLETTAGGHGEGVSAAPRKDWVASRLGPNPPATQEAIMGRSFMEILAACGCPPALFSVQDGTAQRESLRRYFSITVEPLAGLLAAELSAKLEADIGLSFKGRFAADLTGRARSFQSMVKGGMATDRAAALAGLMEGGE